MLLPGGGKDESDPPFSLLDYDGAPYRNGSRRETLEFPFCALPSYAPFGPGCKTYGWWQTGLSLKRQLFRQQRAPILGIHVGHGLREGPAVAAQVFHAVLTLAEFARFWRAENTGAELPRPFAVRVDVFHGDEQR